MSRVFIDTNIPMYAAGASHPLREPARQVILAIATSQLDAVTNATGGVDCLVGRDQHEGLLRWMFFDFAAGAATLRANGE